MLNEKLIDSGRSPVYIEFLKIEEYPHHIHDEMEIIYLLKGKLDIDVSVYNVELNAGHFFVVNNDTMHYLKGVTSDEIALIIHIDIMQFKEYYPNIDTSIFICNSEHPGENYQIYNDMKKIIMDMTGLYLSDDKNKSHDLQNACISLLLVLVNNFQNWHLEYADNKEQRVQAGVSRDISTTNIYKDRVFQIQRLRRIVGYLYENYPDRITLGDMAELEHVSKYYLSHLITTGLGTNFQDFLNGVRVEKSLEYLYGTKLPIEEISEKCGFSSVNFFRKSVGDKLGETPSALRKKYAGKTIISSAPQIYKYDKNESKKILKDYSDYLDPVVRKEKKEVANFLIDISASPTKEKFEFSPHIYLPAGMDIWDHDFFVNLKKLKRELRIKKISFDAKLILEYYNKTGSWDYIHRFIFDLKDLDIGARIISREESPLLDSFINEARNRSGIDIGIIYLGRNDRFFLYDDPTSIVKAALVDAENPVHVPITSLIDRIGLRRPSYYAVDVLRMLAGNIVSRGHDHVFTSSGSQFKLIIFNNHQHVKDCILNLVNINSSTISRVFRLGPQGGDEAALWEKHKMTRPITEDLKWSIENVCAPKTEMHFMESSPEQDMFIPLEHNEIAMIVLDV